MYINLDHLTLKDARDLLELRSNHEKEFNEFCRTHPQAGLDDEFDDQLNYLEKCFKFFLDRGYIKE